MEHSAARKQEAENIGTWLDLRIYFSEDSEDVYGAKLRKVENELQKANLDQLRAVSSSLAAKLPEAPLLAGKRMKALNEWISELIEAKS